MSGRRISAYVLMTIGGLIALLSGGCTLIAFPDFGEMAIASGIIPIVLGLWIFSIGKLLL